MSSSQKDVFQLTKTLYDEMYQYYQANSIGEKQQMQQFVVENIEPLYPSKPVENLQNLRGSDIVTRRVQNNLHTGRIQIRDRKASLGQYTEFQFDYVSEEQKSDKSKVIYNHVIRRYKIKELCLKLGTGNFFFCSSSPPDKVYEDMGLSTCLYLKFVKHLISALFVISPLSIFMMIMFYLTAIDNEISPWTNYKKFLFSFSIGTLSLQGINCRNVEIGNTGLLNGNINVNLSCAVGFVNVIGSVYTRGSFESLQNCRKDIDNFLLYQQSDAYLSSQISTYQTDCHPQSKSCSYQLKFITPNTDFTRVSVTYECINGYLQLGSIKMSRYTLLYLTIIFDLLAILILIAFLWSQIMAQAKQERYFKDKQFLLNAFTLQVGPFDIQNLSSQIDQFLQYIEGKDNPFYSISLLKIVQIRLPDDPQFIQHQRKRKLAYRKLYNFIGEHFIKQSFNPYLYLDSKDFIENHFQSFKQYKKYANQLIYLLKQYKKCQQLKKTDFSGNIDIYITFEKPKYRRIIFDNSHMGKIKTNTREYSLKQVVPPELLLWQNIYKSKFPRIILSIIITFATMMGSYILLAFIWSLRKKTMTNYNFDVDCTVVYKYGELDYFDSIKQQNDQSSTYVQCYCLQGSFLSINTEKLCQQWSARYFQYLIIPLMFSLTAIGLNILLSLVYKKLSAFEAYHKLTSQLYSYIVKKTCLLVLLLSMVIISLSFRQQFYSNFDNNSPFKFLYSGLYRDISPDWYQQIGVIIIITLAFNIITPLIQVLLYFLKQLYIKVRILMFTRSPNYSQLKKTYMQFYKIDIFPIQQRYAELLAITTMCLSLSCVFPIMIFVLIIQLGLFAMIDKILIIKAYHKPINFQQKLHRKVIYSFFIIILMHLVVTAILLSQRYMLASGMVENDSILEIIDSRISSIFATKYIIPYVIIFFVIIIGLISIIFSRVFYLTKPNKSLRIGKDGLPFDQHKLYNLLNSQQLKKTILLKQKQWKRLKILSERYFYPEFNNSSKKKKKHNSKHKNNFVRNDNKNLDDDQQNNNNIIPPSSTTQTQQQQQLQSAQRMLIIPESQQILPQPQSLKLLDISCIQNNRLQQSQQPHKKLSSSSTLSSSNKLKSVIKYAYHRLEQKKQKNEKDKLRVTRLMGMSTYEHYDDWFFMEDFVKGDYKIQGL